MSQSNQHSDSAVINFEDDNRGNRSSENGNLYPDLQQNGSLSSLATPLNKGSQQTPPSYQAVKDDESTVIDRAAGFFQENNDNYNVTWEEANELISLGPNQDPSKPPVPGCNQAYVRWRLRRIVESLWFRILTLFLILFDVSVVIADLSIPDNVENKETHTILQIIDLTLTVYFVFEIVFRISVLTPTVFFKEWYNMVDFAVVCITFISVVVTAADSESDVSQKFAALSVLRFVRIFRLIRLFTQKKQLQTAMRQMVSQNKRRYQVDGYDLDLTYVTPKVIATSFPSSGIWAWYRNPIEKVAAFLNDKHAGKYKMYNLCSEKTYDVSHFKGATVERFMIDDHNVPSLVDMLRFAENVRTWLEQDPENVIVVHCKGGKGRTGTMICVWLIETGIFSSAEDSLDYFGHRRTDTNVSNKFQGVETPSQARYVGYFERMKKAGGILPEPNPMSISEIRIRGMMYIGKGTGEDFWLTIDQGRGDGSLQFDAHIGFRRNCDPVYDPISDLLTIRLINCPKLDGDIRVLFQSNNPDVPKGYEKVPFYFWFNTGFIPKENPSLLLKREQLDNPHKPKLWNSFREKFQIEVIFTR